jgi:hypothetical protein
LTKIEPLHSILSLKQGTKNTERTLKTVREKKKITYKCKPFITAAFSVENLKAGRAWSEVF